MKRTILLIILLPLLALYSFVNVQPAKAASNEVMISDDVFDNTNSMSAGSIQTFLNQFPNSCLKNHTDEYPNHYSSYDGNYVSAATIIKRASDLWGINPQVILTKLEQEENLVTGNSGCALWRYVSAVGFNCPGPTRDTTYRGVAVTTCVQQDQNMGFSQQVTKGSWLLKWAKERANDNIQWDPTSDPDDDRIYTYSGPYTNAGNHVPCLGCSPIYHDGYFQGVDIQSGATASLYNYTPFLGQAFDEIFEGWFGSPLSDLYYSCGLSGANVGGAGTGVRVMPHRPAWGADNLSLTQLNITGTGCIEIHKWANADFQTWSKHTATNRASVTPADARVLTADTNADGIDEFINVEYQNTSSGKIEMHVWDPSNQRWIAHIASNRPAVSSLDSEVIAADANGDGRDELYLVDYRNTASGMIEIHGWSSNYQQWISHVATNRPAINPADAEVISADVDGNVSDEFLLVQYRNTSSGFIEVHGWAGGQQQWISHVATNRPAIDPGTRANPLAEVISADVNGDLAQELHLIQYGGTGSGRVEIHTWAGGQQQWLRHIATSQGSY